MAPHAVFVAIRSITASHVNNLTLREAQERIVLDGIYSGPAVVYSDPFGTTLV